MAVAATPLFDRLVDSETWSHHEVPPRRTLDRDGLRESVRRDLERLLNTRSPLPADQLAQHQRTVIDYGIPALPGFAPPNPDDRLRLAAVVEAAVAAFEPRLHRLRVTVEETAEHRALAVRIDADLVLGTVTEPVTFPVLIRAQAAEVRTGG